MLRAALLGFETSFKHLDGHTVTIKRTGVTKPNQAIRIKGEGMPKHGTPSEFGDLTIHFTVDFPAAVDGCAPRHRHRRAYAAVSKCMCINARARLGGREMTAGLEKLLPAFSATDMRIG